MCIGMHVYLIYSEWICILTREYIENSQNRVTKKKEQHKERTLEICRVLPIFKRLAMCARMGRNYARPKKELPGRIGEKCPIPTWDWNSAFSYH